MIDTGVKLSICSQPARAWSDRRATSRPPPAPRPARERPRRHLSRPTALATRARFRLRRRNGQGVIGTVPVYVICLGHQLLMPRRRGRDYKPPVRPHGAKQVRIVTGRVAIHQPEPRLRGAGPGRARARRRGRRRPMGRRLGAAELTQSTFTTARARGIRAAATPGGDGPVPTRVGSGAPRLFAAMFESLRRGIDDGTRAATGRRGIKMPRARTSTRSG